MKAPLSFEVLLYYKAMAWPGVVILVSSFHE